eukprot:gb/GECG01003199.1/.p1 GENE.gb/GECG01003199.1/~~gb/GECG01003199.1/.p1  ORF type:complete len:104 (+),score=7.80 gb/GECG01003199.1/:1-312(+)
MRRYSGAIMVLGGEEDNSSLKPTDPVGHRDPPFYNVSFGWFDDPVPTFSCVQCVYASIWLRIHVNALSALACKKEKQKSKGKKPHFFVCNLKTLWRFLAHFSR